MAVVDQRRRIHFSDHSGAGDEIPGAQLAAVIDHCGTGGAVHPHFMVTDLGGDGVAISAGDAFRLDIGGLAERDDADVDEFLRHRQVEGEQPLVLSIETRGQIGDAGLGGDCQRHFKCLAGIAYIDLATDGLVGRRHTFGLEFGGNLRGQFGDDRAHLGIVGVRHQLVETALRIDAQPRRRIAIRAKHPRRRRNDHRP